MQGNRNTSQPYQRRRRMDRNAERRAADEAYAAEIERDESVIDVAVDETPQDAAAAADQPQPNQPVMENADRRTAGRPFTKAERPWQQDQPSEWTDHIRVVRYDDDEQVDEPEVHTAYQQLATDRVVRLAATIAGMCSLFALFLLVEEGKSHALRHYSVQSVALSCINLILGGITALIIWVTGAWPIIGFVIRLASLLVYFGSLAALIVLRVQLMRCAWHGYRWDVPVIGHRLQRFVKR